MQGAVSRQDSEEGGGRGCRGSEEGGGGGGGGRCEEPSGVRFNPVRSRRWIEGDTAPCSSLCGTRVRRDGEGLRNSHTCTNTTFFLIARDAISVLGEELEGGARPYCTGIAEPG